MSNFSSQKQYIYKPKGNESKENDQPHDKENIDLLPPSQNSHWKNCITNGKESLHRDWFRGWKGFSMLVWYIGPSRYFGPFEIANPESGKRLSANLSVP